MRGPVEIAWEGRGVDIGGVKARALAARLLIDRQIIVSVDRLVDSLWGDNDGPGAEIALRSTIPPLRKRLRDAGVPHDLIVTRAPGYVLDVSAAVTDAARLERLVAEARLQLASTASAPVRPADGRGRGALARTGLQRSPRRAVRPGRSAPAGGAVAGGHRDEDGREVDARPA